MRPRCCVFALVGIGAAILVGCRSTDVASNDEDPSRPPLPPQLSDGTRLTVAAAGDFGIEPTGVATLETMAESRPDLFLGLGDFGYAGPDSEDAFCDLVRSKIGAAPPFEIVAGNHEEDPARTGAPTSSRPAFPTASTPSVSTERSTTSTSDG